MELGVAGVDSDDEEGLVGAEVVEGVEGYAAWAGFGGGEEFGFALVEVGGVVDYRVGGLGEEWGSCECEGEEETAGHAGSFGMANCNLWCGPVNRTAGGRLTSHPLR